jgi:predicted nucleic acid-binding protein
LILLDANALIALLLDEPAAAEVADLIRRPDSAIPAPCVAEVLDRLMRRHQISPREFQERVSPLLEESLLGLTIEIGTAQRAGEIRADHYKREGAALSLADCLLLASAGRGDEIATADGAVIAVARKIGVDVVVLPDSGGRRPD